jgi:hypothetical protein
MQKLNDTSAELMKYFSKIFKIYPPAHHKNMYLLIFYISISHGGLLKSDLNNLFFQKHTWLGWEKFLTHLTD